MTLATTAPILPSTSPDNLTEPTAPQQWPYRMSLEVYERIAEAGLIPKEDHVVLLDGLLVQTMTQNSPHYNAVDRGRDALKAAAPGGWYVRADGPVWLRTGPAGVSALEPDLAVVVGSRRRYETQPPNEAQIGLLVEVASDTAAFRTDRQGLARYAYAGIPRVWIVTLHDQKVHLYSEPSGPSETPAYGRVRTLAMGETIDPTPLAAGPDQPPAILGPIAVASFFNDPDEE